MHQGTGGHDPLEQQPGSIFTSDESLLRASSGLASTCALYEYPLCPQTIGKVWKNNEIYNMN